MGLPRKVHRDSSLRRVGLQPQFVAHPILKYLYSISTEVVLHPCQNHLRLQTIVGDEGLDVVGGQVGESGVRDPGSVLFRRHIVGDEGDDVGIPIE